MWYHKTLHLLYFQTHKPFQNKRILDDYRASEEFATYEALCRGEDTHVSNTPHEIVYRNVLFRYLYTHIAFWLI